MIFKTKRLKVRPLQPEDFPAFNEMQANINVMRYTTGKANTEEENKGQIKKLIDQYEIASSGFKVWAIIRNSDDVFVGTCAIISTEEENEIGYRFLEKYWGMGYGKEITNGLIDYALDTMHLKSLVAYVVKENIASVKILESSKLKFIEEVPNEELDCMERVYRIK